MEKYKYSELSKESKENAQKDYLSHFLKGMSIDNFKMADKILSTDKEYFDKNGKFIEKISNQ